MKKIAFVVLTLLLSQASTAQLAADDLQRFQILLVSTTNNPVRDCADSGMNKLYIYRVYQVTRKTDAEIDEAQLPGVQDEALQVQLRREIAAWQRVRMPNAPAQVKFDACLNEAGLPTSEALSRLHLHCFGNSLFAIDVLQAKDTKQSAAQVKARMARVRLALSPTQASGFIDEVFAARNRDEEFALARELFSSCVAANNGRH
ncbi:MAG TPA: hypothetical protein VHL79_00355 [Ramlibacter sp.]|jgi:hypothetical protein|nr:hypothetical protein [Ramlibacter sp.]